MMKKQQFVTVLAVLGLCACMVLAVHQRWRFPLVNAVVNTVLLPVNGAVRQISDGLASFRDSRRLNATLQEENSRLKKELDNLRSAEYRLKLLETENKELQAMAGYKQQRDELMLLPARVIGVSLGDLHEFFYLDKGSTDGVRPDMVVTTSAGVAGVVDQVYRHYSRFMLISASQSRMGVRVLRRESRAVGVLTGQGPNRSLLQAEYFGRDDDVLPGDMLVTSGIGGKFPAGLCIGTVSSVEADVTGLQKLARIEPAADLSHPDRVFVILQEDMKRRIEKEIAKEAGEAKP
ncbi:MAG: rod shape-determining protein MreC [Acidaminococcaceae bacterium]|nr:rod shape-determining protein MreC [Acidaminococcaceae bacterium]